METLSIVLRWFQLLLLFTSASATAEETILEPTAVISIDSERPFATMKPCASSCLVYSGVWACGVNSGYYDLGIELSCGCSPKNFCYCDVDSASRASSYISSCVNDGCGTEFPSEVTSALDLYNGYCSTANVDVAASTTSASSTGTPTLLSIGSKSTTGTSKATSTNSIAAETLSSSSSSRTNSVNEATAITAPAEKKNSGLTSSDVIALGGGLGVGVPSLLLGIVTFCLQRRIRGKKQAAVAAAVMEKNRI